MIKIIKTEGYDDSDLFTKAIKRKFEKEGYEYGELTVKEDITSEEYFFLIEQAERNGELVFPLYPLPRNISPMRLSHTLKHNIDCIGKELNWMPITPKAIVDNLMEIMEKNLLDIEGKVVTIINRTKRIGLPISVELTKLGATVIVCNSYTDEEDLSFLTSFSDIVITAMGNNSVINNKSFVNIRQIWIDCSNDVSKECIDEIIVCGGEYYGMNDVGKWTLNELVNRYKQEMNLY